MKPKLSTSSPAFANTNVGGRAFLSNELNFKQLKRNKMSKEKKSGMYGEMPKIKIGKYTIAEMSNDENENSVWVQDTETDEGGQFQKEELLPILETFFNSNF